MWHPGMGELLIMLVIVMIVFGAGKLPSVGKSMGQAIREFKSGVKVDDNNDNDPSAKKEATE